jgi:hypothetical protein
MTTPTQGEHAQTAAQVQRYKIGYPTDSWGERSSTPSGIPDHAGAWVRYEDHAAHVAALTAAQPAAPQGVAEVNWWEADGDKYDDSISPMQPAQGVAYAELPKDVIRAVFIENGFTVKEGQTDLKQYVYDAAIELLRRARLRASNGQAPAVAAAPNDRVPEAWTNLLAYVLQDDLHNRLTPRIIDIAYTAFMQAKRPNDEDGGPSDWFNDTRPMMRELIAKLRKDLIEELAAAPAAPTAQAAPAQVLYLVQDAFAEIAMAFPKAYTLHKVGIADTAVRETLAAPAAGAVAGPPEYGAMEFGWTYAHIQLADGDKRLIALVVRLFGNEHQAFSDLEALVHRAHRAPTPAAQADSVLEDADRWRMAVLVGKEVMLHPEKRTHANAVKAYMDAVHSGLDLTGAVDAARKQGGKHD